MCIDYGLFRNESMVYCELVYSHVTIVVVKLCGEGPGLINNLPMRDPTCGDLLRDILALLAQPAAPFARHILPWYFIKKQDSGADLGGWRTHCRILGDI
jgi:hypothetical protein